MGLPLSVIRFWNHRLSFKYFLSSTQKLFALSISLLVFIIICVCPVSAQWTRTNGPEGVAVSTMANINGIIYAGTEVNGIYASTDDGLTWVARNSGIETYGISSIISFQGYIFAGTRGGGVYRSSDGGLTWTAPTNGKTLYVTSLVANDPFIFAGAGSLGVYRSSDNGVTWEQKLNVFGVGAMCKSGNKIFASESNYTDYTTDNGETWMNVQPLEGAIIFSFYCTGDTILAGGQTKVYRSLDNGNTFTTINLNLGFSIVNIYDFTYFNSTLYAATSYDGVYKSTDFGSNWTPANGGMGPKDVRAITVTNSSSLLAGTHYVGMYRSTDLGLTWNKSQSGFPAGISILSLLESESSVYAGTRDGVFRTDDNGDSWVKIGGANDTTMYSDVWAICEHNGVIYASMQLYFDATIYKSTDKGSTWIRCDGTGLPFGLSFIKGLESSGNNLVAGTDEGIYYSTDGGNNWNPTNVPTINIPSLASSGNYVYAAVPSGAGVYRSIDNGVSWSVSLQSTVDYIEVAALENYAYAGSFFGGARYSSSYGNFWLVCSGFPSDASIFALGPIGNGMVLAGTDLDPFWIYASFDNGNFYSSYSEGLFERASVEAFAVNDTFMFAGTDYNGVWRRLRPGVVNAQAHGSVPEEFNLSQNYPNPFNPSTIIEYSIPESGDVKLEVYNSLGEELVTLVNEYKEAGNYNINLDAADLSSGIYYYRLTSNSFNEIKKMILLK